MNNRSRSSRMKSLGVSVENFSTSFTEYKYRDEYDDENCPKYNSQLRTNGCLNINNRYTNFCIDFFEKNKYCI
jgi:hypothetical protein